MYLLIDKHANLTADFRLELQSPFRRIVALVNTTRFLVAQSAYWNNLEFIINEIEKFKLVVASSSCKHRTSQQNFGCLNTSSEMQ